MYYYTLYLYYNYLLSLYYNKQRQLATQGPHHGARGEAEARAPGAGRGARKGRGTDDLEII